jgi:hypothetical protein
MELDDDEAVIGADQRGLRTGDLNRVKVDTAAQPNNISFPIDASYSMPPQGASAGWPPGTACFAPVAEFGVSPFRPPRQLSHILIWNRQ